MSDAVETKTLGGEGMTKVWSNGQAAIYWDEKAKVPVVTTTTSAGIGVVVYLQPAGESGVNIGALWSVPPESRPRGTVWHALVAWRRERAAQAWEMRNWEGAQRALDVLRKAAASLMCAEPGHEWPLEVESAAASLGWVDVDDDGKPAWFDHGCIHCR